MTSEVPSPASSHALAYKEKQCQERRQLIIVLEKNPWFSAGFRQRFPTDQKLVLFRSVADAPLIAQYSDRSITILIDFETCSSEGIAMLRSARRRSDVKVWGIFQDREIDSAITMMSAGLTGYFIKPVRVDRVARLFD